MMFTLRSRYFYDFKAVRTPTRHRRDGDWWYESVKLLPAVGRDSSGTLPDEMLEPQIKSATSEAGCCPHCEAPHRRVVHRGRRRAGSSGDPRQQVTVFTTLGWEQGCRCPAHL